MNTQPTLKDVAEAAGVGLTTASLVVNGKAAKYRIGQGTQERVLAAVRQLGYKPNTVAQRMALGLDTTPIATPVAVPITTTTIQPAIRQIGLVLAATTKPESLALIPGLEPTMTAAGYQLVVVTLPTDAVSAKERVSRLLAVGVAGFLACPSIYTAVTGLVAGKCPVIVLYPNAAKAVIQALTQPESWLENSRVAEIPKSSVVQPPVARPAVVDPPIVPRPSPVAAIPVVRPPIHTPIIPPRPQPADTEVGPPEEAATTRLGNGGLTAVSAALEPAPVQPEELPTPPPEPVAPIEPTPAEEAAARPVEPVPSDTVIEPVPPPVTEQVAAIPPGGTGSVPSASKEVADTEVGPPILPPVEHIAEPPAAEPVIVEQPVTTPEPAAPAAQTTQQPNNSTAISPPTTEPEPTPVADAGSGAAEVLEPESGNPSPQSSPAGGEEAGTEVPVVFEQPAPTVEVVAPVETVVADVTGQVSAAATTESATPDQDDESKAPERPEDQEGQSSTLQNPQC